MQFSETEIHILKKIALAPTPVCAFDLSNRGDKSTRSVKDPSTIQKACKKLIERGILETDTKTNDKNVPKKVMKFTLYGFCQFVEECDWFPEFGDDKPNDDAKKLLKNWQHLHESIKWAYTIFSTLKRREEYDYPQYFLYSFRYAIGNAMRLGDQKPPEDIGFLLYYKIFDELTGIVGNGAWGISAEDIINVVKNSKEGMDIIKLKLKTDLSCYETLKRIDELL